MTRHAVSLVLLCAPLFGGEYAVLTTGFRIHADRHETDGATVRLIDGTGVTELPALSISGFEVDEPTPALAPAPPAPVAVQPVAPAPVDPRQSIEEAARLTGVPAPLLHSVARAESGYRADAVSRKGAIGLMQLMPATAAAMNADPHDAGQNAYAGALYLRQLLLQYQGTDHQVSRALAAYNAGPGAVQKYKGVPPYRETREYVNRVIERYLSETAKQK